MSFFKAKTIRRLLSPRHELSCSWITWMHLLYCLRQRGNQRSRESGAFLLGYKDEDTARIVDFVLYDDLDPHCLDSGIVNFDGRYFGLLWDICKQKNLSVVADVHVHPGIESQSGSDKNHPMISQAGHIALILPDFASAPAWPSKVGIYRYKGSKQWLTIPKEQRSIFFHIGI